MLNLKESIADIRVGNATVFGGLAVFPLKRKASASRDYLTLNEALALKGVEIKEVSESGSVPELKFSNRLDKGVFAADGETLLGAKQNRVLNSSIYVEAGEEIKIPVSCVEQGRWSYRSPDFRASEYSEFVSSRATKVASVGATLKRTGTDRYSDQGAVWDKVNAKRMDFHAEAPTSSMADVYDAGRIALDEYLKHIRMESDQLGLACAVDGRVIGLELFEDSEVFSQHFEKLIRAYAAEVVNDARVAAVVPDRFVVRQLLRKISTVDIDVYDAVGTGKELRFSTGRLSGSALTIDERLMHLVLLSGSEPGRRH